MAKSEKLSKQELDYIVHQINQAQKETASTVAPHAHSIKLPRRLSSIKTWLKGIFIGMLIALVAFFTWHLYMQKTAAYTSGSVVASVQKLSTLATAQAHVKTIISKEDNKLFGKTISFNLPGTQRTIFLVVPAEVTAGVDLKDVTKKDLALNPKTKTISITLPHATIVQDPSIDLKNIQTFSNDGILRGNISLNEGYQLADLAKQKVKQDALQSGLLKTAEDNATIALQDFFKNLGYTVTVNFK